MPIEEAHDTLLAIYVAWSEVKYSTRGVSTNSALMKFRENDSILTSSSWTRDS